MSLCAAIALGVHIGTVHLNRDDLRDANPGFFVSCDSVTVGGFMNSNGKRSFYGAYTFERVFYGADLSVGVVSGYAEKIRPLFVPSYRFDNGLRVGLVLPFKGNHGTGLHFSYEF